MSGPSILLNGVRCSARVGMTVLEAAGAAGIRLPIGGAEPCSPHSAGCETCRIRLLAGDVEAGGSRIGDTVLACRARIESDAAFAFPPTPRIMKTGAEVLALTALAPEIVELVVRIDKPIPYLPGQHVLVSSGPGSAQALTPTLSLEGLREHDTLHFHLRRRVDGLIGDKPGRLFGPGTRLKLSGPYGQSFLRPGEGRIVLVSSGTGFAAIWSIAVAARLGQPHRPVHLIASAHDPHQLYMRPAVEWLARQGVREIILTASGAHPLPPTRNGRAIVYLPNLVASDSVYAAGHPLMVRAVLERAARARAEFHGIAHVPAAPEIGLAGRLARIFGREPETVPAERILSGGARPP